MIFWTKFTQKCIPGPKQKNSTQLLNCAISNEFRWQISAETDSLDRFFGPNLPRKDKTEENRKIGSSRVSLVFTYYIKLFNTKADRRNGILMSLFLLVAEKMRNIYHPVLKISHANRFYRIKESVHSFLISKTFVNKFLLTFKVVAF